MSEEVVIKSEVLQSHLLREEDGRTKCYEVPNRFVKLLSNGVVIRSVEVSHEKVSNHLWSRIRKEPECFLDQGYDLLSRYLLWVVNHKYLREGCMKKEAAFIFDTANHDLLLVSQLSFNLSMRD